jgi:hypothetical protein
MPYFLKTIVQEDNHIGVVTIEPLTRPNQTKKRKREGDDQS